MSSLADRLAAASRDRATPTSSAPDAMATMSERRGGPEKKVENDFQRPQVPGPQHACSSSSDPSCTTPS